MSGSDECSNHYFASQLSQLLSPEKALYILYNLVDKDPRLWDEINAILHPNDDNIPSDTTFNVLNRLTTLQLSQLPLDVLSVITGFLSLESCLRFSETSRFFNKLIPKFIDLIHLQQDITSPIYKLLLKVERLKYLYIDASIRMESVPFSIPFDKFRTVRDLTLFNVNFVDNEMYNKLYPFNDGTYSLRDLQLICCENIDVESWLKLTSVKHSPNLNQLTIKLTRKISSILHSNSNDSGNDFMKQLVSSSNHSHIKYLNLTLYSSEIFNIMHTKHNYSSSLIKLEIGLMDRRCEEENPQNIRGLFRSLYTTNKKNDKYNQYGIQKHQKNKARAPKFKNLKILIIDFCPSHFSTGFMDITPNDLEEFCNLIPSTFPSLSLLGLFGSQRPLLFGDDHLNGMLRAFPLTQIIDLSIGFEDLSYSPSPDNNNNNIISKILYTFPNLSWLTFENDRFLCNSDKFHLMASQINQFDCHHNYKKKYNLKWITLCCASTDEICELSNGLFVEYWERGIEQCDFDQALKRSQQIANKNKNDNKNKLLSMRQRYYREEEKEIENDYNYI